MFRVTLKPKVKGQMSNNTFFIFMLLLVREKMWAIVMVNHPLKSR